MLRRHRHRRERAAERRLPVSPMNTAAGGALNKGGARALIAAAKIASSPAPGTMRNA